MVPPRKNNDGTEEDAFLANFYSLQERRARDNIGELINIVLDAIEKANEGKLGGLVRAIDSTRKPISVRPRIETGD
jgi:type I restriction enzyme M protein